MGREKTRKMQLECILTDQERLKYSSELAENINTLQRLEDAKKSYLSQIKAEIESAQAQVNVLSRKVAAGKEYREVECAVEYAWDAKEKQVFRKDTWDLVATDIITELELQEEAELNAPEEPDESEDVEAEEEPEAVEE